MTAFQVASPATRLRIMPDLSSPLSFRTARDSLAPQTLEDLKEDTISNTQSNGYSSAKVLPYELRHHCLVYLEEQIYTSALSLLNSLLISGTSYPNANKSAFVPPPNHIALTGTLLVHPTHTTRASSRERLEVSLQSFTLLRNLLSILGPLNANLGEAFTFTKIPRRTRNLGRKSDTSEAKSPNGSEEEISVPLAGESSLWARAQDFWNVVGWALICSVKHWSRWEYWSVWLEYMLDVLEADWEERLRLDEEAVDPQNGRPEVTRSILQDCILMRYLTDSGTSSGIIKRIVKSVFADGSIESLRAYPEVFENETRVRANPSGTKRKRESEIDMDLNRLGGNFDDDEDGDGDESLNSSQPEQSSPMGAGTSKEVQLHETTQTALVMGGPQAMVLRLRLLALLSRASEKFPGTFINIRALYDIFYEVMSPLPLPAFSLFLSTSARPYLPDAAISSLCQVILLRLLPNAAPSPATDELSQESLERCFLPYAANTSSIEDNAKVSLVVETLFRLFMLSCPVDSTPALAVAVKKGIAAREKKSTGDRRKKQVRSKNDNELAWLNASAGRIGLLLQQIQKKQSSG